MTTYNRRRGNQQNITNFDKCFVICTKSGIISLVRQIVYTRCERMGIRNGQELRA